MLKKRKRICELEMQYYLQQLVAGIGYIHQQKVIHREYIILKFSLKLGNIMINENM